MRYTFISLLVGLLGSTVACSSAAPQLRVLGTSDGRRAAGTHEQTVRVFLEVSNPSKSQLELSRLRYRLSAGSLEEVHGEVSLRRRMLQPQAAAVIEVSVPINEKRAHPAATPDAGAPFALNGTLFARSIAGEQSWGVHAEGTLHERQLSRQWRGSRVKGHLLIRTMAPIPGVLRNASKLHASPFADAADETGARHGTHAPG